MVQPQTRVLSRRFALFAYLLLPVICCGQSTFGDIRGTARDPGSLPVSQAVITLHNVDENTNRATTTDNSGTYLFENLKPGHYQVSGASPGFANSPTVAIDLVARQSARVDIAFSIQQVQQSVTVEAAAAQINTENGTVGDTRGNEQLEQMPLNFRAQTTSPLASLALS